MFCKFCGTQINDDDLFCPNCGQKRTNIASSANAAGTQTTPQQEEDLDEEPSLPLTDDEQLERAFITGDPSDTSHDYAYKRSFAALKSGGNAQWNIDLLELFSRKLYLPVILMSCVSSIINFFTGRYGRHSSDNIVSSWFAMIPFVITFLVFALFGDKFLYNRFITLKKQTLATFPNDLEKQKAYMAENGGTKLEDGSLFCPNCGQKQNANPVVSNTSMANAGTSSSSSYSSNTINSMGSYNANTINSATSYNANSHTANNAGNANANTATASVDANSNASYGELVTAFVTGNPAAYGGSSITFFVVSIVLVILIMVILVAALGSAVNELSPLIYLFNYL